MSESRCSNCSLAATKRVVHPNGSPPFRIGVLVCDTCASPFELVTLPIPPNGIPHEGCAYVEKISNGRCATLGRQCALAAQPGQKGERK